MEHGRSGSTASQLQSLPPELSTQIVRRCVPQIMDSTGRQNFMALRTLCSQWRSICFDTPEFWSTLTIDLDEDTSNDARLVEVLALARGWFNRSGLASKLELSVVESEALSEEGVHLFVDFVHKDPSRWKALNLTIDVSDSATLMFLLILPRKPVQWLSLHSLFIGMQGRFVDTRFLSVMPSLRRLKLDLIPVDIPGSPQVTSLELTSFDPFFPSITLPPLYPSLTTLTLHFLDPCTQPDEFSTFECLAALNLVGELDVLSCLDKFVCPALRNLSFQFNSYDDEGEPPSLRLDHGSDTTVLEHLEMILDLLRRSQTTLRTLKVLKKTIHGSESPRRLRQLAQGLVKSQDATLEEVELFEWPWDTSTELGQIPLPCMQKLTVGHVSQDDGRLFEWLQRRAEKVPHPIYAGQEERTGVVPRLYLAVEGSRGMLFDKQVKELVGQGWEVYVQ